MNMMSATFAEEAKQILNLPIECRVNGLGGYGAQGEVVYESHPVACPTVLVDNIRNATATFISNGSVGMMVKLENGMEVNVLDTHFDTNEKREINPPSNNVWLRLRGDQTRVVSLMNSRNNVNCASNSMRIVKLGDPDRAMWFCNEFDLEDGPSFKTAVKLSFVYAEAGPALLRQVYIENTGVAALEADLYSYFSLHGTQCFAYNKEIWYDAGVPLSDEDTVICATVPYSDIRQIKRVSTKVDGLTVTDTTCDYSNFVGNTGASALWPDAVLNGTFCEGGAGRMLSRFSTPAVAAQQYAMTTGGGAVATLEQSILYVNDMALVDSFREAAGTEEPHYLKIADAFKSAASDLVAATPDVTALVAQKSSAQASDDTCYFRLDLPNEPVVANYANSVWTGVTELYENCRAHGAKLADGIELGTRDRGQDMWPKMKQDPGRVRADLVHAMSFLYRTVDGDELANIDGQMTLKQKLHGMFPRQFPSVWLNRDQEIFNDNRPYTDSPVWLINSLCMYARETGDLSLLTEQVKTVCLSDPEQPEISGMIGNSETYHIAEVVEEVLACFERHCDDSPYGMCQIIYGDWCDPVDMYGTSEVGNAKTRGKGRGVQVRLSAHVFQTIIEFIDLLESPDTKQLLADADIVIDVAKLKNFADRLRQNIVKVAWEEHDEFPAFINVIHELKVDGTVPNYSSGDMGYTLGSYQGRDFDGINRRDLNTQGFCLGMLRIDRDYLTPIADQDEIVAKVFKTIDTLFYDELLGLVMYSVPLSNHKNTVDRVGRMGVVPTGTAENGEYHHCQVMAHCFRLEWEGQADTAWKQFKPMMSAMRDEDIGGPFDMPCTSYVSDREDPHFGKAMYFGLSGSTDWIVELFQRVAGLKLSLHDAEQPDLVVEPRLPETVGHSLSYKRMVHAATGAGKYAVVPVTVDISRTGEGDEPQSIRYLVNGEERDSAVIDDISQHSDGLNIQIQYQF